MIDTELFINLSFSVLGVITVGWTVISLIKIFKLRARFNAAIVLIPLYKRSKWPFAAVVLVGSALIADTALLILYGKYYTLMAAIMVICVSILSLLIAMIKTRCAVLDSGVVVPFRFIDWTHLYDYQVEGNKIFFCGDAKGNDTLGGATARLGFDEANTEKLHYILSKHKQNI